MQSVFIAAALFAVLALIFMAGPRVARNLDYTLPDIGKDLDHWLQQREAQYSDIVPGTEKTIIWADPSSKRKTRYAFVYLHGFSASRGETAPVPDAIAAHFNSNLFYTRLQGHGRGQQAMADSSVNGWVNDAAEAISIASRLGDKIVLIGCSTGAAIAWWTAHQARLNPAISALVLFSPNFSVYDKKARVLLWPWGETIARLVIGPYRSFEAENEQVEKYWTTRYPVKALLPMMAMVDTAARYRPEDHTIPTFMAYSNLDTTVDATVTADLYERLAAPRDRLIIDDPKALSNHVVLGDVMAPEHNAATIDAVTTFLSSLEN